MHALLSLSWGFSQTWTSRASGGGFSAGLGSRWAPSSACSSCDGTTRGFGLGRSAPRTPPTPRFSSKTDPATTTTTRTARFTTSSTSAGVESEKGRRTTSAARTGWVTRTTRAVAKRAAKAAARGATAGVEMPDRPGWREIAGDDVQGVWALNLPWAAEDMFAAPAAQCSDGAFDLLVFKGHSRLSLLLNLLKLDAGRHVPHSRVTYVKASELEVVPARRPRDRADTSRWTGSWWRARGGGERGRGGRRRRRRRGWGGGGGGELRRCAW